MKWSIGDCIVVIASLLSSSSVPFFQSAHRGFVASNANAQMVNPVMVHNIMNNAMDHARTQLSYSYETDQSPVTGMYPEINQDLQFLSTVTQM